MIKARWIAERHGMAIKPWQCNRTDYVSIIGLAAYEAMSDTVYELKYTLRIPEVPGVARALRSLALGASLHVVTARTPQRMEFARLWFEGKGLSDLITGFASTAGFSKAEVCRVIGAAALVDDDTRHLDAAHADGLRRVLLRYGSDGHGEANPAPDVAVCHTWAEVLSFLRPSAG